jgi:hypothetical protein
MQKNTKFALLPLITESEILKKNEIYPKKRRIRNLV